MGGYYFFIQGEEVTAPSENETSEDASMDAQEQNGEDGNGAPNPITEDDFTDAESQNETGDLVKEFSITAKQFAFEPGTITVKRGDRVRLRVTSTDVTHGLAIPEFGVNVVLNPNQEEIVDFTASTAGTFTMFCSVFCGDGHPDMNGTLIVEE